MKVRFLFLAVALLCLLALPVAALADDSGDASKIDPSVTTVLEATGGDQAVPVLVYTEPDATGVVQDAVPAGVETTELPSLDAVAAYLTPDEITALSQEDGEGQIHLFDRTGHPIGAVPGWSAAWIDDYDLVTAERNADGTGDS